MSFREFIEMSCEISLPVYSLENIATDHVRIVHKIVDMLQDKMVLALFKAYLRHGYYPFYFEGQDLNSTVRQQEAMKFGKIIKACTTLPNHPGDMTD